MYSTLSFEWLKWIQKLRVIPWEFWDEVFSLSMPSVCPHLTTVCTSGFNCRCCFLIWEFPVIHYLVLTSSLEKPNQAFVLFLFNQIIPILGRPIFLAFTKLTYRVLYYKVSEIFDQKSTPSWPLSTKHNYWGHGNPPKLYYIKCPLDQNVMKT